MNQHVYHSSLYNVLRFALENPSERKILDCDAGGSIPPLSLFYSYGFETYGIDVSKDQIEAAKRILASTTNFNTIPSRNA